MKSVIAIVAYVIAILLLASMNVITAGSTMDLQDRVDELEDNEVRLHSQIEYLHEVQNQTSEVIEECTRPREMKHGKVRLIAANHPKARRAES